MYTHQAVKNVVVTVTLRFCLAGISVATALFGLVGESTIVGHVDNFSVRSAATTSCLCQRNIFLHPSEFAMPAAKRSKRIKRVLTLVSTTKMVTIIAEVNVAQVYFPADSNESSTSPPIQLFYLKVDLKGTILTGYIAKV